MSKSRQNRKKEQKRMDEFHPEFEPDGEYYSCSDRQEHAESCHEIEELHPAREFGFSRLYTREGKEVGCITVSKWDVAIAIERRKWKEINLDPNQLSFPPLEMKAEINAALEVLKEKGIATKEEFDEQYQIQLYQMMKQAREDIAPSIQEMRRRQLTPKPGELHGPDGKPLKLN